MYYKKSIFILLLPLFFTYCNGNKNADTENLAATEHIHNDIYTCPMHPQIKRDKPGSCPICGMALVKQGVSGSVESKDTVSLGMLLKPTNSYVISSVPVITTSYKSEQIDIEALGVAAYNTQYNGTISAKISGRIEKLYMRYNFQDVMKGQKVMDIYSPELLTAQQNLLYVVRNDAANQSLISASKERLKLLGLSSASINQIIRTGKTLFSTPLYSNYSGHIHEIEKNEGAAMPINQDMKQLSIREGMYVNAAQPLFSVSNPDHLWALIQINPDQQKFIKRGTPVKIYSETKPNQAISGFINLIEPIIREGNKTITARVNFENRLHEIPVGSQLRAKVSVNTPAGNWLPNEAVVSLGNLQIAFLKTGAGFKVQAVETGLRTSGKVEILNGVSATDAVAKNGQYLMDSESFIKVKQQ